MAKSRVTTNPMYKGGAGGFTFYVRGGEQVIRQRKNNSNYGETASRTRAQMIRRIRWGNLVNCYKAISSWQKKAYDSKVAGQTDYNIFMQLNINRCTVGETKEMCEGGCAVFEGYQVSRGSLAPVDLSWDSVGSAWESSINYNSDITNATTIGALSQVIMLNNPDFLPGDNIAIIFFKNYEAPRVEWPFASSVYAEITLDASNTALLSSVTELSGRLAKNSGDKLSISARTYPDDNPLHEVGCVVIRTRKSASYLKVSSQSIVLADETIVNHFSGSAWDETCINSYGIDQDAPLEPSFKGAVIADVAINGSSVPLIYGRTLVYEQPVTLVITGNGMNSETVYLEHNGIRYTPLNVNGNSWTYILGDNGLNKIYVNGSVYGAVQIRGVVVPSDISTERRMVMRDDIIASTYSGDFINVERGYMNCMNYPYKTDGMYNFAFTVFGVEEQPLSTDFEFFNCTANSNAGSSPSIVFNVSVEDISQPAYVKYKGFIIYVFNYEA